MKKETKFEVLVFLTYMALGFMVGCGLAVGNFLAICVVGTTPQQAFERSFFQMFAVMAAAVAFWGLGKLLPYRE